MAAGNWQPANGAWGVNATVAKKHRGGATGKDTVIRGVNKHQSVFRGPVGTVWSFGGGCFFLAAAAGTAALR